jgi:hypothetical protein
MMKIPFTRASSIGTAGILASAAGFTIILLAAPVSRVHAYALGSQPGAPVAASGTAGTSYNFGASFGNLVAPFMNFIRDIQMSGGTVTVGIPGSGSTGIGTAGTAPSAVNVTMNLNPFIDQFEAWFARATGIQINGAVTAIEHFFAWAFSTADTTAQWIARAVSGAIPQSNGAQHPSLP